jgi:cytochrome c553
MHGAMAGSQSAFAAPRVEDMLAQRVLAGTGRHGAQGHAAGDGYYPRIAGNSAGCLFNQSQSFRDDRRPYGLMNKLLAPLTDAYLHEIANHFASLDLRYPPPQRATASGDVLSRGETLVRKGDAAERIPVCVQLLAAV